MGSFWSGKNFMFKNSYLWIVSAPGTGGKPSKPHLAVIFHRTPKDFENFGKSRFFFWANFSQFLTICHTFLKTLGGLIYIGLEFMKFRIEWCQEHPERMEVDLVYKGAKLDFSIIFSQKC